ncbi:MAG: type II/IV secretion system ATPase subunit [Candidatus Bathyarchaeota archaeon]|nr:type II/IV secretion system ATPase subunit [Candidatus Bathyarchaeota archaeon]
MKLLYGVCGFLCLISNTYSLLILATHPILETRLTIRLERGIQTKFKQTAKAKDVLNEAALAASNVCEARRQTSCKEVYPVQEPYVYAAIVKDPETHKTSYEIIEPTLTTEETQRLAELKKFLMEELDVNFKEIESPEKAEQYLQRKIAETVKRYRLKILPAAVDKLVYYIVRDFIGYGKIDALMRDHLIEDISADGVNVPLYVWHRQYESMPTNIKFGDEAELDSFIVRLAYLAGKNVSVASPILDASLPEGSRIQLTFGKEITRRGSTFTIRRFKADPLTISDLIAFNTLSSEMAAYLWYIIENRASVLVAGGVACGKTTILNCLSMFIKPEMKIISVEDTQELNLAHENWIPSVVRADFKGGTKSSSSITLFDLLRAAMRQRPDYIIVGEVRGEEAYTLFQAMATGHLGMCTFHAESVESVINRLKSEPMNIPKNLIAMTNVVMVMTRTEVNGKPARRASVTTELTGVSPESQEVQTEQVFRWNPKFDKFSFKGQSPFLQKHMEKMGLEPSDINREIRYRKAVLEWMVKENIRKHADVAQVIREYYLNPNRVFQKAKMGLK